MMMIKHDIDIRIYIYQLIEQSKQSKKSKKSILNINYYMGIKNNNKIFGKWVLMT